MDALPRKQFGKSVAVSGNTCVIGSGGSAYVFKHAGGGQWTHQAKLENSGHIVAISGKTIVTGKPGGHGNAKFSGVVTVYMLTGGEWIQQTVLSASDAMGHERFGDAIAIDRKTIAVGAWGDTPSGDFSGSAYVFRYQNNKWIQKKKLTSPSGKKHDYFGASIDVYGTTIVDGATSAKGASKGSGAVFLFK
jgi:hypothetical protein